MAFFGISQQSTAVTATTSDDDIAFFSNSATAVASATTLLGLAGNDLVSLGAQGRTAIATASGNATFTQTPIASGAFLSGSLRLEAVLVGSATYRNSGVFVTSTGLTTGGQNIVTLNTAVAITGVITAERGLRQTNSSQYYLNAGDDTIYLGNSITTFTASTIGGGDGNDVINNDSYLDGVVTTGGAERSAFTAATYEKALIEGGGGDDAIRFAFTAGTVSAASFQGGQGNDTIQITATNGTNFTNNLVAGGGGNDDISAQLTIFSSNTIAGGGGNDTIDFAGTTVVSNLIVGDTFNAATSYDGSDRISGVASTLMSSTTIQAGAGNDTISITYIDAGSNLFQMANGDDVFATDSIVSASTIQGGAGNDSISLDSGAAANTLILAGGDNDVVTISAAVSVANTTLYGGNGADQLATAATLAADQTYGVTFGYDSYTESTVSAMDSIAVNNARSGVFNTYFSFGGLSRASFTTSVATATNGVAIFTATFDNNVTARVSLLDSTVTTQGAVVLFQDGNRKNFAFVKGSTDDLVFEVGDGANNVAITQLNSFVTLTNNNKNVAFSVI